jgi:hypothetical protein
MGAPKGPREGINRFGWRRRELEDGARCVGYPWRALAAWQWRNAHEETSRLFIGKVVVVLPCAPRLRGRCMGSGTAKVRRGRHRPGGAGRCSRPVGVRRVAQEERAGRAVRRERVPPRMDRRSPACLGVRAHW